MTARRTGYKSKENKLDKCICVTKRRILIVRCHLKRWYLPVGILFLLYRMIVENYNTDIDSGYV